jgi:uncharacterized protein (DUF433 family)
VPSGAVRLAAIKLQLLEAVMDLSLVSHNPEIMGGVPCFTGTRVPVTDVPAA